MERTLGRETPGSPWRPSWLPKSPPSQGRLSDLRFLSSVRTGFSPPGPPLRGGGGSSEQRPLCAASPGPCASRTGLVREEPSADSRTPVPAWTPGLAPVSDGTRPGGAGPARKGGPRLRGQVSRAGTQQATPHPLSPRARSSGGSKKRPTGGQRPRLLCKRRPPLPPLWAPARPPEAQRLRGVTEAPAAPPPGPAPAGARRAGEGPRGRNAPRRRQRRDV